MKKKLFKSISLVKKKFKNKEFYYYFEVPDFAILIPKIKNKYLLVYQKREPINKKTLEFPSGWVDKNESPLKTSVRETFEETGYKSKIKPKKIIDFHEEPGRLSSKVHVYSSNKFVKNGKPEIGIKICFMSKVEILKSIKDKKFSNGTHIAAFFAYLSKYKFTSKY